MSDNGFPSRARGGLSGPFLSAPITSTNQSTDAKAFWIGSERVTPEPIGNLDHRLTKSLSEDVGDKE